MPIAVRSAKCLPQTRSGTQFCKRRSDLPIARCLWNQRIQSDLTHFRPRASPYQRHGRCPPGGPPPRFTGTEELPDQPFDGYPIGPLRATACNGEREEMRLFTTGTRDSDWIEAVRSLWCKCMHEAAMWPIHGWYRCRTCHRRHPVPWASRNHHLPPPVQRGVWSNHVVPEVPK